MAEPLQSVGNVSHNPLNSHGSLASQYACTRLIALAIALKNGVMCRSCSHLLVESDRNLLLGVKCLGTSLKLCLLLGRGLAPGAVCAQKVLLRQALCADAVIPLIPRVDEGLDAHSVRAAWLFLKCVAFTRVLPFCTPLRRTVGAPA
jgi:hypothetical protein